ncbi:hypothetical protein [Mycobacterium sp. URHB0021]
MTGIHLDEGLLTAARFDVFAVYLPREGTVPQGQNPCARNVVGMPRRDTFSVRMRSDSA